MIKQKHPPPRVIAIDVDGTLFDRGIINRALIEWVKEKKEDGYQIILWSSRGENYAKEVSEICGTDDVFDLVISKPGYIVDDQGWSWIKYTRVINVGL